MSSADPPHVRVELYDEAKFFDDNFLVGWMQSPEGQVSVDGDVATLTVKNGETEQHFGKNFDAPFSASVYKYLSIRIKQVSSYWFVAVQRADTEAWVTVANGSTPGFFQVNMAPLYSGTIKAIDIITSDTPGDTMQVDYVVISKNFEIPSEFDITGKTVIKRSLLNSVVSAAEINLINYSGDPYLDLTDKGNAIIWVSRDSSELGNIVSKVFGGKIAALKHEHTHKDVATVKFELHGHAAELFDSPELVYKLYAATNGRTIIDYILSLCKKIARHPDDAKWFDAGGSTGSTDDRINSNHDAEYDEVKPLTPIQEILDKAENPTGVVGFDMYEMPSGALIGHLRRSNDFVCPITPTLQHAIKTVDPNRVKNRQKVYGAIGRQIPEDEIWTESLAGWIIDEGDLSLVSIPLPKKGTYSLYATYVNNVLQFRRDISSEIFGFGKRKSNLLEFWRMRDQPGAFGASVGRVELWAPDENNKFVTGLKLFGDEIGWRKFSLSLGSESVYNEDENPNGVWTVVGSPDWTNLHWLCFRAENDSAVGLLIDWLLFSGMPFSDEVEDSDSISEYGIKEAEPVVDQTLLSNTECKLRANDIVEKLKNPPTTVTPITVDGDIRYNPGDLVTLSLVGSSFRILEVEHIIQKATWDTRLTVSES